LETVFQIPYPNLKKRRPSGMLGLSVKRTIKF